MTWEKGETSEFQRDWLFTLEPDRDLDGFKVRYGLPNLILQLWGLNDHLITLQGIEFYAIDRVSKTMSTRSPMT